MKRLTTKEIFETMTDIRNGLNNYKRVSLDLSNNVAIEVEIKNDKFELNIIDSDTGITEMTIGSYDYLDEVGFQLAKMFL